MCCGFFGGGGEDGTSSTAGHAAAMFLVSPDDFCGEEVEVVDMADFTEASDRCTSGISSSSFRSEYHNHDGNNEISILKSNNDEISILKSKFRRQKAKSRNQCKVYAVPIPYIE